MELTGELSDDLVAWVEGIVGAKVTAVRRVEGGASREIWFLDTADGGRVRELVLRREAGGGPLAGTEFTLALETEVYRSLAGTSVPVPEIFGITDDGMAVLMSRVAGRDDFASIDDAQQADELALRFMDVLGALHRLDPGSLAIDGLERPASAADHVLVDLGRWQRAFEQRVERPEPLVRFGLEWLRRNAPDTVARTVLVQGDTGPGNFLFEGDDVTAVLDWEFAHLGDPMDDLAWIAMRDHLQPFGDLGELFGRYQEASGIPVDAHRVLYYRAFVLVRTSIACLIALESSSPSMIAATYHTSLQMFRRLLCQTLAELMAIEREPVEIPEPAVAGSRGAAFDSLVRDLTQSLMPELGGSFVQKRAQGMVAMLMNLREADAYGTSLDDAELDDMTALLGARPASVESGLVTVDELVRTSAAEREQELFRYLDRRQTRTMAPWRAVLGELGAKDFPPVPQP